MAPDERSLLAQLPGGEGQQQRRGDRPAPERQRKRRDLESDRARGHPVAAPGRGGDQQQQGGQRPLPRESVGHRGFREKDGLSGTALCGAIAWDKLRAWSRLRARISLKSSSPTSSSPDSPKRTGVRSPGRSSLPGKSTAKNCSAPASRLTSTPLGRRATSPGSGSTPTRGLPGCSSPCPLI